MEKDWVPFLVVSETHFAVSTPESVTNSVVLESSHSMRTECEPLLMSHDHKVSPSKEVKKEVNRKVFHNSQCGICSHEKSHHLT